MAQEKADNDQLQSSKASAHSEEKRLVQLKKKDVQNLDLDSEKPSVSSKNSFPAQFKSVDVASELGGEKSLSAKFAPIQRKENKTGLPENLKSGMENLSGFSMDDVKVHRNSDKPAQLNAHAYAQGTDIHLGPGQEKHLAHELGHVVQQKQGRVKPTKQLKGKTAINDDVGLEKEADVLGAKAASYLVERPIQRKDSSKISGAVAQRDAIESASTASDNVNESMKVGAGGAALAEGKAATDATNGSGVVGDFMDGANAFKNAYLAGKEFFAGTPKEMSKGATVLAEGSKGILAVIKASIAVSGESQAVKDSAGKIIPGIGAAIGAFQNVMSMMQNQATWTLVDGLDNGTLTDKEKEKVASFVSRLDAKLGLDIVDFIFNIAEFIAMFTGTGPAVALVHSCFNIFKGACEITHGYFAAKGLQADQRVSGGEGDVDREQMAALDLHLKESNDNEAQASKSIFGMVKSHGAIKSLKASIAVSAQQVPPDEGKLKKDRDMLALRERLIKIDLKNYNDKFKPDQVSDPNSILYGKVNVPELTIEQIPVLYKIHMNVIREIIKQSKAGAHGYSRFKAWAVGVKKDEITQALETKLGSGFNFDKEENEWTILSKLDPEQASYFTEKTKTAIHVASKRKYFGDDELQANLQKILIDQQAKFLPLLVAKSSDFTASMDAATFKAAVEKNVKF